MQAATLLPIYGQLTILYFIRMIKIQPKPEDEAQPKLLEILNNTNKRYIIAKQEYLLLLKKQKDKDYCTLYITDCQSKFWIKKIDIQFMQELKETMSINTDLKVFCQHFVQNLKSNSKITIINNQLKVGTGLLMNCKFSIQTSISLQISPTQFKVILKLFLKQLFQAKQAQIQQQRKKWERYRDNEDFKMGSHSKADPEYIKEVLNPLKKDGLEFRPKNRSLLNPNQKRRKGAGIKFQGEEGK